MRPGRGSHHDHVCPLRHVDESGNGGRVVHFAVDPDRAGCQGGLIDDLNASSMIAGPLLLPLAEARWQRRLGQGREATATTWTRLSGVLRIEASRAAQSTAAFEAGTRRRRPRSQGAQSKWTYRDVRAIGAFGVRPLVPTRSAIGHHHKGAGTESERKGTIIIAGTVPSPLRPRLLW